MQKSPVGMQFANQPVETGKNLLEKSGFNRRWFEPAGWFSEHWQPSKLVCTNKIKDVIID
jgi:hypothetical protein